MAENNQQLEQMKQKYGPVLRTLEQRGVRLRNVHIENGKLLIRGEAPSQEAKNAVWDQIKLVNPSWQQELLADITVNEQAAGQAGGAQQQAQSAGQQAGGGMQTYTVQAGDTLSAISQRFYGSAGDYMKIFEANRDQLNDPNKIRPGQTLKIPVRA
ncbi:MAG: LysM peptidoglycan-binding domain-containing protein [Bryobacteraceae bacterium]|nr:LysM peptidoglycan-binding domain-containing protein [Bryobacteraceae bacterium]